MELKFVEFSMLAIDVMIVSGLYSLRSIDDASIIRGGDIDAFSWQILVN